MRGNEFLDKMELIDPAYVEAADAMPKKTRVSWIKWVAAAACFSLTVFTGFFALRKNDTSPVPSSELARNYKNVNLTADETAIVWPWEYLTISEQYTTLVLNGKTFNSQGRSIDPSLLGETIGNFEAVGSDPYTEEEYRIPAEVRQINGVSENQMVAVKLGDMFYVFQYNEYTPPVNFGEVLDDYCLAQTLSFDHFTVCDGYTDMGHYSLKDDGYIWDVLTACRDAEFIPNDFLSSETKYISFTATSDALGVYRRVFYVTSDGYVKTNIFDWAYSFKIGEDAANKIISYAEKNGVESVEEPYTHTIAGTLVEITDDFILVDDSILCLNQADGMVFKVPTDDLRISRCINFEKFSIGDIVVVYYTGDIDIAAGNVVKEAYSMSRGIISDNDVFVEE